MREVEISIEKLANGGAGFGRCEGKAFFVPFTAPGDVARVKVLSEKSSYAEGSLVGLLKSSSQRVVPPCPVFGSCGGCNWQHVDYSVQLEEKRHIFSELLWRSARISSDKVDPILPAPEAYGYRSRIQLKVAWVKGVLSLGFYGRKSHQVIDLPGSCAITHDDINKLIVPLRQFLLACPDKESFSQIDIARGDEGKVCIIFHYKGYSLDGVIDFIRHQTLIHRENNTLLIRHKSMMRSAGSNDYLCYRVPGCENIPMPGLTMSFSAGAFSQVNYQQNLYLIDLVAQYAGLKGTEKVLDLYCGNGNFSIPLAFLAAEVIGLEEYQPSIDDAIRNAADNDVANVTFLCGDAVVEVENLVAAGQRFDLVVLDPPRKGAADVVHCISNLHPTKIIYISCDPATLARDVGILKNHGYELIRTQGVDMFPQSYHLESVTLLLKSDLMEIYV